MPKTRRSTQRLVHSTELEHEKQFTMTEMQREHDKSLSMLQAQHEKEMALQKQLYEMQISHEKELRMCEVRFKEELEKAQKGSGNVAASTPNVTIADIEDLSPAQFAARKVVNKKLPKYRGEPDRWPLFYSSYINSSKACGYSNIENLTRLIECLEGEAMEAVQGYLIRPESVPEAIEVLKELFGSPGKVLKSLLHQVRQLPAPTEKNLESFIKFSLKVKQLNEHITACELTEHADNPLLVEELVIKLPISDQREWVRYKKDKTGHRLALFTSYLQEVMRETNEVLSFRSTPSEPTQSTAKKRECVQVHNATNASVWKCWVCKKSGHVLKNCFTFKNMSLAEKIKTKDTLGLCERCLRKGCNETCTTSRRCNVAGCMELHNPLLHRVKTVLQVQNVSDCINNPDIIFRTIPITLYNGDKQVNTMAFIDEGSSATLIEEGLADALHADGKVEPLVICWTNDVNRQEDKSKKLQLSVSARNGTERFSLCDVRTVSKLQLPEQKISISSLTKRFVHLRDIPVDYDQRMVSKIIIGLNNMEVIAPLESRVGRKGEPIAVKCKLGWTIYGANSQRGKSQTHLLFHHVEMTNRQLHDAMHEQYLAEEIVTAECIIPEPVEDKRAREILQHTTIRRGKRFETGLLWRKDLRNFPDSLPMAERRMKSLETRLQKDPELRSKVHEMISEYQLKGYAHKLTEEETTQYPDNEVWYLPLNVVQTPKKPGKVRLVWDAAATVGGVSLNTELLKGPDLLIPLPKVVSRFREKSVAFGGDLQEMFHQLLIRNPDKQAQRFLYGAEKYVLDVATFGATCSPCSAQYVKNLNAMEHSDTFPRAAKAVIENHYVDDYYDSVDSVEEAITLAKEVKFVHEQGGFHIRNWMSNSSKFLEAMNEKATPKSHPFIDKAAEHERVLGVVWNPHDDCFYFSMMVQKQNEKYPTGDNIPTKRKVFSFVMSQFDPMGFIAPITVRGKMIIQDIWRSGCDWDTTIDKTTHNKWLRWIRLLQSIESMSVPRAYFGNAHTSAVSDIQLHIFTDASDSAYGCVAYLRAVVGEEVKCALVMSRTKVAPIKQMSIPRLELLGAVLGAKLARAVKENHNLNIVKEVYWTDAKVVLSWIRSDQRRYKQFVGFRIGALLSMTNVCDWRWIPTKMNVADMLTKWGNDPDMTATSDWVRGPSFLYEDERSWPNDEMPPANTTEELRAHLLLHRVREPDFRVDVSRFSKWTVLVRTIACVYRFISNCLRKKNGIPVETVHATLRQQQQIIANNMAFVKSPLKQEEYEKAERLLIRQAQIDGFLDEYRILERRQNYPMDNWITLEKSSPLYKLSTMMDHHGILRMEGRTAHAEHLPFDLRFPIILPSDHPITVLIARSYHEKCGHGYRQAVKNELRQLYYIPHADAVVRKVSSSCLWCKVNRNKPEFPRMAPMPIQRLTPNVRPFCFTGVDFMGPFDVAIGRRHEKRWIVLFTCMVIRAVHLEVAHGLSTQACLMAIRRFIGRRGWPKEFFSDNGTNFQGASKEITNTIAQIEQQWADQFTNARTKWTFNPPAAPHMGGVWERLVRSVKTAMSVLDDGRRLTDEILQTVIVEAEDMINSRPLTTIIQGEGDELTLTPNLFLRGYSSSDAREMPTTDLKGALKDEYLRTQQLSNDLWNRWIKEYVPNLNPRTKWYGETKPLEAGDLVYIVDGDNRKNWVRGIVEEPIVAKDGRVRQVWVRTNNGRYRRATGKLAVLELH